MKLGVQSLQILLSITVIYVYTQGCGLRRITWNPKIPNHEILVPSSKDYIKKKVFPVTQRKNLVACDTWTVL